MRMGQTLIFLVLLMMAFSAIIDPAPGTLGDVSKSPLTTGPSADPPTSNPDFNNMSLEDLGKMINDMLAQLNQTAQDHPNLVDQHNNSTGPAENLNSTGSSDKGQSTPDISTTTAVEPPKASTTIPDTTPNTPTPPTPTPTKASTPSPNDKPSDNSIKPPLTIAPIVKDPQPKAAPVQDKSSKPDTVLPQGSNPKSETNQTQQESQNGGSDSTKNPGQSAPENSDPSSQYDKSTVEDLLNGNYFTYFVDLNAQKTGRIFINGPDTTKKEQKPQSNQTQPSPINTPKEQTQKNQSQSSPTQAPKQQPQNNQTIPVKEVKTAEKSTSTKQAKEVVNNSSKTEQKQDQNKTKSTVKEQTPKQVVPEVQQQTPPPPSPSPKDSSSSKDTQVQDSNVNSVALCHSNDDCLMQYIDFISLGLEVVCTRGVCQPHF